MVKVLVTGACGFIGRHVVKRLRMGGYEVYGCDLSIRAPSEDVKVCICDVRDRRALLDFFSQIQPSGVIHLAARTDIERFDMRKPYSGRRELDGSQRELSLLEGYDTNITGVANIVDAVMATNSVRRVIFTSTQLVHSLGQTPSEGDALNPTTTYGRSKAIGEQLVRERDGGGREWCIVRPTTVWGEGMSAHYVKFMEFVAKGLYVHPSKSDLHKSYGYVGNVAYEFVKLLEAPLASVHRKVFYLADYEPLSLRRYAEAIARELGAPRIRSVPSSLMRAAGRVGDIARLCGLRNVPLNSFVVGNMLCEYRLDLNNTRAVCGELPFGFEEAVRATVAWFVEGQRVRRLGTCAQIAE